MVLEPTSTSKVARPNPRALATVEVTASSGQSPSSWTSAGLLRQTPLATISLTVDWLILDSLLKKVGLKRVAWACLVQSI